MTRVIGSKIILFEFYLKYFLRACCASDINRLIYLQKSYIQNRRMKNRTIKILAVFISFSCLMINLYCFVNRDVYSEVLVMTNIAAAFLLLLVVILPAIEKRMKK